MAYVYGLGAGLNLNDLDIQRAIDEGKRAFDQMTNRGGGGGNPNPNLPPPGSQSKTLIAGVPDVALYAVAAGAAFMAYKASKKK